MWRYKKGDQMTIVLEGTVVDLWGRPERPLYRVALELKEGTQPGTKRILVDVSEDNIIDMPGTAGARG